MRRGSSSRVAALVFLALVAASAPAAAGEKAPFFQKPKVGWVIYSAAWLGASIWAQPRSDFSHGFFSYVPATYTGLYLGSWAGGTLASNATSGNWGPALAGMLIGGALGAGAGLGLGYAASRNTGVYYGAQGAYVSIVMFTLPIVPLF